MSRKIELVASEDEEYRLVVDDAIQTQGFYMLAVSDLAACEIPGCTHENHDNNENTLYDKSHDAFVYTVGQHLKKRPELIVFCGPAPGEPPVSLETLGNRIEAAVSLIKLMVDNWETNPVLPNQYAEDYQGRLYTVFEEDDTQFKDSLMYQCIRYYNHDDFDILVIYPNSQSIRKLH